MRRISRFLPLLLLLAGLSVLLYPTASNWLASRNHSKAILDYAVTVEALSAQEAREQLERAARYNSSLTGSGLGDAFGPAEESASREYLSILNIGGMIGYVEIPSIGVHLPIHHTTSEEVLRRGAGHLSASAFPIGGNDSHAVLTAHRGLPSAQLFTDLDRMEPGDSVYIHVLDQVLGYQVDQILVVEPHETEPLQPVPGKDYLSLVTCTPYAVNSHRLLVRGERMPPEQEQQPVVKPPQSRARKPAYFAAGLAVILLLILLPVFVQKKRRQKKGR